MQSVIMAFNDRWQSIQIIWILHTDSLPAELSTLQIAASRAPASGHDSYSNLSLCTHVLQNRLGRTQLHASSVAFVLYAANDLIRQ